MVNEKLLCPFNGFVPCKEAQCGVWNDECSLRSLSRIKYELGGLNSEADFAGNCLWDISKMLNRMTGGK